MIEYGINGREMTKYEVFKFSFIVCNHN